MPAVRPSALVASVLLAAAALAVPAPAQANGARCQGTDPGFVIAGGQYGAVGVDNGVLVQKIDHDAIHSTCVWRGAYWSVTLGSPKVYPGRSCTWRMDVDAYVGVGPRYGVSCP